MNTQYGWLLNLVCYLPAAGALLMVAFAGKGNASTIKRAAVAIAAADFLLAVPLWFLYRVDGPQFQFMTRFDWIPSLGVEYHVGVDGFAVLLILLTTLLGLISVLGSYSSITVRTKEFYANLLVLQTGALGVFCALDLILFYVFFEVVLVPAFFLIGVWGGPRRLYSAVKFFLYHLVGSVLMLVGILALYFFNAGGLDAIGLAGLGNDPSFSVPHLTTIAAEVPPSLQLWVFLAFFAGLAVRVPVFPFHTWLADAHVEAPTAASIMLAGVGLKIGAFGLIRFSLPLLPNATVAAAGWVGALAIISIIYGALIALAQKDMKSLIATLSISQMGLIVLGLFTLNGVGMSGAMLQMLNHGVSFGALLLMVGFAQERRGTRMIAAFGGLGRQMPRYAACFLILALSAIGMPGLNGFIGQLLVLMGAFTHSWAWALLAVTGVIIGAACVMWMYQRVFFGEVTGDQGEELEDLGLRERLTVIPLIVIVVWIGLVPQPFLDRIQPTVDRVVDQISVALPAGIAVPVDDSGSVDDGPGENSVEVEE